MTKPSDRNRKKKKRVGTKGKVKEFYARAKTSKHECSNCGKAMHGMPHGKTSSGVRKMGKTERRPSALFAGQLCNKCRALAVEDAAKISAGIKKRENIDLRLKKYVEQLLGRMK
jgi:ribosomal protein L34E